MPLFMLLDLAQTAALIALACYVAHLYGRIDRRPKREGGYNPPPPYSSTLLSPPPPPPEPPRRSR